ncbi:hypothetical protein [Paenibacillus beijingensis]|uniref:LysM domain-containing protein n=1 Tax=Paenibacillus beijingensis TaxID=1126833 RepID=A0A0D5NNK6_9BACL|nr:hypothetical protein [Paenibacillus beijingensis]AJY76503.1 hypothetical protein VN24_20440 [Paenibacillus beijingensis]
MKKKMIMASALALTIAAGGGATLALHANAAATTAEGAQKTAALGDPAGPAMGKGRGHSFHMKLDEAAIAKLLGMTEADLRTAQLAGKSLAAIASDKGVAVQKVIDLVTKQLTTELDKRLADGKITQSQYDTEKAGLAARAKEIVNGTFIGKGPFGGPGLHMKLDEAAIAKLLGVTEAELETARHAGKSLATIAGEKGVAVQKVIDLVTKQLTTELDKRLADGKITQSQYDTAKAGLSARATELVNGTFIGKGRFGGPGFHMKLDEAAIAKLLGVTEADLETARHAGKSLAAIAGEKGVAVQSVIDLIAKQLTTALDERLADGNISQSQYDTAKADLAARAEEIVNGTFAGKGGPGMGKRGLRGHGHMQHDESFSAAGPV